MNLGIDATNVTQGGGITHISSIMNSTNKELLKFKKIIIWGNNKTLKTIKKRKNLKKIDVKIINNKPIKRFFWQLFSLEKQLIKYKCDHALILGGISFLRKIPTTIILQNLLPFDELNIIKYRFIKRFKLYLQKFFFSNSINNAKNIIFLSNSSKKKILSVLKKKVKNYKVIPHGIDKKLILKKITKKRIFSKKKLFKILYVSKIEFYKNQIDLLKVAKNLNEKNYKIIVDFLGPFYEPSLKKFNYYQDIIDPQKKFTKYIGEKSFNETIKIYKKYDLHVVPSTCETFGQIVLEAMASGIPNACSDIEIFRETTNNHAAFFKSNNIKNMTNVIEKLIISSNLRYKISNNAIKYLKKNYSWKKSSYETFKLINQF